MKRHYCLMLVIVLTGCAHRPPEPRFETIVSHDCSESADTEDGRLTATREEIGWARDLGDGMRWGLSLTLIGEDQQAEFATKGFHDQWLGRPLIFVDFADRFHDLGRLNYWDKKGGSYKVASVFRIGNRAKRQWVPVNVVASLTWAELEKMLADEGDLVVALYDVDGTIYQRGTVPRAAFARVEQALKAMHGRVMEKERDRERLCIRTETTQPVGQDIIIT